MPTPAPAAPRLISNKGVRKDLEIAVGATFGPLAVTLTDSAGTPLDLTGCTLVAQVRRRAHDDAVLLAFDCSIPSPTAAPQGLFGASAEATAAVPYDEDPTKPLASALWDMRLVDSTGRVLPVFWGAVRFFRGVTRA